MPGGVAQIKRVAEGFGPGTTALVYIRNDEGAHIFNLWVDETGQALFIETQGGAKVYDEQALSRIATHFEVLFTSTP